MQEVQQSKGKTLANNRTLAEQNLILQPNLEHKKEQLTKIYRRLQDNFESYQLRKSTLGSTARSSSIRFRKTTRAMCLDRVLTRSSIIHQLSAGCLGNAC